MHVRLRKFQGFVPPPGYAWAKRRREASILLIQPATRARSRACLFAEGLLEFSHGWARKNPTPSPLIARAGQARIGLP